MEVPWKLFDEGFNVINFLVYIFNMANCERLLHIFEYFLRAILRWFFESQNEPQPFLSFQINVTFGIKFIERNPFKHEIIFVQH